MASNFPQEINNLSLGLTLLQQKSVVLTKPTGQELLDFSDITASITDYSKPLFLGVEFNGKAINNASSSSNVIIGLNVAYTDVLNGYTIMQVELPSRGELDINHSSIISIRLFPRYGSSEFFMTLEGYGSPIAHNFHKKIILSNFQSWQYLGNGTLTVKIYQG